MQDIETGKTDDGGMGPNVCALCGIAITGIDPWSGETPAEATCTHCRRTLMPPGEDSADYCCGEFACDPEVQWNPRALRPNDETLFDGTPRFDPPTPWTPD